MHSNTFSMVTMDIDAFPVDLPDGNYPNQLHIKLHAHTLAIMNPSPGAVSIADMASQAKFSLESDVTRVTILLIELINSEAHSTTIAISANTNLWLVLRKNALLNSVFPSRIKDKLVATLH